MKHAEISVEVKLVSSEKNVMFDLMADTTTMLKLDLMKHRFYFHVL